jgi:membrane-bound lytic murein transglycosylase F
MFGCSPLSENVVKKAKIEAAAEEDRDLGLVPASDLQPATESLVDPSTQLIIRSYGPTIKKYAEKYGFDWRLILAVMKAESRFSHDAESEKGATGFMQIMPVTSNEVGRLLAIKDMAHPKNNIHGGVYYLRKLYNLFDGAETSDRIKLTLAAYNAGIGRVYDAQMLAAYFHDNPRKWDAIRDALPLLSKRFYTLHKNVWGQERPKVAGWFGNSQETITYVDRIMDYYDEYRLLLN